MENQKLLEDKSNEALSLQQRIDSLQNQYEAYKQEQATVQDNLRQDRDTA